MCRRRLNWYWSRRKSPKQNLNINSAGLGPYQETEKAISLKEVIWIWRRFCHVAAKMWQNGPKSWKWIIFLIFCKHVKMVDAISLVFNHKKGCLKNPSLSNAVSVPVIPICQLGSYQSQPIGIWAKMGHSVWWVAIGVGSCTDYLFFFLSEQLYPSLHLSLCI